MTESTVSFGYERPCASADGSAFARAAILSTVWGTIVYFDEDAGELRHKEMNVTETNCVFVIAAGSGHGMFLLDDARDALVQFEIGGRGKRASDDLSDQAAVERCFFIVSIIALDEVSLQSRGRFLGCVPDGSIGLSNTWRKDWERFKVAEVPRALLPALERRLALRGDLMRIAGERLPAESAIERRIIKGGYRRGTQGRSSLRGVIVCRYGWLADYICFEHYHLIRNLHVEHGFDVLDTVGIELADGRTIDALNRYEVVLVAYQGHNEVPLNRISAFKILRIDDLESYDESYQNLVRSLARHSHMLIGPYAYEMSRFFPHPKIRWLPYSSAIAEEGGVLPFNDHPIEKLFVSGSLAWDRPFRQFVADLRDSRIHKLEHPGYENRYDQDSAHIVRGRWFEEIRKYLCAFCDAHSLRYIHLRAFEVASVGTLLLVDDLVEAEMKELGFVDKVTCVFCNRDNFLERLGWVLAPENRGEVDRIREAGMKLCHERHLTARRAADLVQMIESDVELASYRMLADVAAQPSEQEG